MAPPINRRAFLRQTATASAVAAAGVAIAAAAPPPVEAAPSEPDPVFAAIARHSAARFDLDTSDSRGLDWHAVSDAEHAAWNDFADTHPATPAGLAAMAAYVLHSPSGYEDEDCMRRALTSVAVAATRFAHASTGRV